jgi:hypothetical protein
MATTDLQLNAADGWVEAAPATDNFIIDSLAGTSQVLMRFADSAPDNEDVVTGHEIKVGVPMVRAGCSGKAYVRTNSVEDVTVLVSVGAI